MDLIEKKTVINLSQAGAQITSANKVRFFSLIFNFFSFLSIMCGKSILFELLKRNYKENDRMRMKVFIFNNNKKKLLSYF